MNKGLKFIPILATTFIVGITSLEYTAKSATTVYSNSNVANINIKTQSVSEGSKVSSLYSYYSLGYLELKNVQGNLQNGSLKFHHIDTPEILIKQFNMSEDTSENKDVFIVREHPKNNNRGVTHIDSIGGVTPTNQNSYIDYITAPNINIKQTEGYFTREESITNFYIYKEKISLKELDFKLRKILIEKHKLYKKRRVY
ncbi:hypothetical protein V062_02740 [Staphylococcus aureus R0357]|nr:hypothetical protein [Staphylococcus aureus]EZY58809.1 hypothetical protein V060_02783 [Staphylococcus aureus R0294]EZY60624.1 hypothetical protein V061_02697 [Staphylococcus aureus R0353]EZY61702.1 hypothetical protein V062_02740 [Staphylococcus aureus R0357]EZY67196.1 hypothetical protein V064_02722 [Staphylococcus aureus R0545]EZY70168.1 hypothetical protein V065_02711 [Staphylococcus aureus R0611]